ncbi:MAG: AlkA N-terminal domain-containing protein [Caldilineaceae bacterium]
MTNNTTPTNSLNSDVCYQALVSKDTRFDGKFYVGVASTGIYCRTVCTAKTPRRENCTFYPSAAAAEQAGFRPCLRCRPELAPGNSQIDAVSRLAGVAAGRIEEGALTEQRVADLALELGVSERHLRRVIQSEFGVSPVDLAQTQRLLLAKRLLTDTNLPIIDVAFASGFASLRRFNALFKERYRLNPSQLRKQRGAETVPETLICELAYRPPLDWAGLLAFLGQRLLPGVEAIEESRYLRTVQLKKQRGWIGVESAKGKEALRVELSTTLAPMLLPLLTRVKRLFDLAADPAQIGQRLGDLAAERPGLRVPAAFDGWETALHTLCPIGQVSKLVHTLGQPIETPFAQLTHLAPTAQQVVAAAPDVWDAIAWPDEPKQRICQLAQAVQSRQLALIPGADIEQVTTFLRTHLNLDESTVQYLAMRALAWPDALPQSDPMTSAAIPAEYLKQSESWRPWRAYAALHLWKQ